LPSTAIKATPAPSVFARALLRRHDAEQPEARGGFRRGRHRRRLGGGGATEQTGQVAADHDVADRDAVRRRQRVPDRRSRSTRTRQSPAIRAQITNADNRASMRTIIIQRLFPEPAELPAQIRHEVVADRRRRAATAALP
jgi:hypothetical protein